MLRVTCPDLVARDVIYEIADVGALGYSTGYYDSASELVGKSAALYFIQNCHHYLLDSCGDDFRQIFDGKTLVSFRTVASDLDYLLAETLKLVRHARSECKLDVLCKPCADLCLALYVVGNVLSSEWN